MFNQLLKKVIKTGVGRSRFIMAGVGLMVAMLLILSAIQIQANYHELLYGKNNQDSIANFLVINRVIDGNKQENNLSKEDITQLKQQPFVQEMGQLSASRFKVSAQSPSDRFPFYTDIFFESVPNEFIDVQSKDWQWQQGAEFIPMIIPNQFLDLFNFGFAPSQNLMQLTQDMVMSLPIIINIHYNGQPIRFTGKVVGFSDRISSVLVPQNFLEWANAQYGTQEKEARTSRVVIKTNDPGNPQLTKYLKEHDLVTDADKTRFSKYRQIVNTVVNASWITGAVMLLFAILVFSLFIQLTIASTKNEINLLITIGTSPKQLKRFLMKQFLPANIAITLICLATVVISQYLLKEYLQEQNMYVSQWISYYTALAALLILIVLWIVNFATISKYVKQTEKLV